MKVSDADQQKARRLVEELQAAGRLPDLRKALILAIASGLSVTRENAALKKSQAANAKELVMADGSRIAATKSADGMLHIFGRGPRASKFMKLIGVRHS